ncbi:MAG: hypothetical protein KF716_32765 [Anaerolineae bacterium]|nr:hypothetical protein [Anaerolineae bacterium]
MDKFLNSLPDGEDKGNTPPDQGGISALDVPDLPEAQRKIMQVLIRQHLMDGISLAALREEFADMDNLDEVLEELHNKGFVHVSGTEPDLVYRARLRPKRISRMNWDKLLGNRDKQEKSDKEES